MRRSLRPWGGVRFGVAEGRQPEGIGPSAGTQEPGGFLMTPDRLIGAAVDLRFHCGAGDRNRTRIASLEGVWRTAVRAAELKTLLLPTSRGYPLFAAANGPLMARPVPWRPFFSSRPRAPRPQALAAG